MTTLPIEDADVQLVVFDLMGTLIVDDGVVDLAYRCALEEIGITPSSKQFDDAMQMVGSLQGRPTLVILAEVLGDDIAAEEATWAFDDNILNQVPSLVAIPGADDIIASLTEQGILTAVTTSFTPEIRKAALESLGWTNSFADALSARGARRGNPAPDLLLQTILDLRIDSVAQVAIVGDSAADLEAGNRAGAGLVIGVRTGNAPEEALRNAPHTHIIDSVAALPTVLFAPRTEGQRRVTDRSRDRLGTDERPKQ